MALRRPSVRLSRLVMGTLASNRVPYFSLRQDAGRLPARLATTDLRLLRWYWALRKGAGRPYLEGSCVFASISNGFRLAYVCSVSPTSVSSLQVMLRGVELARGEPHHQQFSPIMDTIAQVEAVEMSPDRVS
jgi:hypothetical protein